MFNNTDLNVALKIHRMAIKKSQIFTRETYTKSNSHQFFFSHNLPYFTSPIRTYTHLTFHLFNILTYSQFLIFYHNILIDSQSEKASFI